MNRLTESIAELRENEEQWRAFLEAQHCVVLAPPGSGKTKLLTTRMAHDLVHNISAPHGAACITLTNPAADEIRRRVGRFGLEPRPNIFVGTVHGFALTRIIYSFAAAAGMREIASYTIASDARRRHAMQQSIREVFASTYEARFAQATIERHRKMMATGREWAMAGEQIIAAARRYEELLRADQLMDFDDIVTIAVRLVEENLFVRRVIAARYHMIYVDEYQDLAPGLDRLVRALCFDYRNQAGLFAVGDPDQAIFGWTGTRPELLYELADRSGVVRVDLRTNYRSREEIIRRAQRMLIESREIVGRYDGGEVVAHYCEGGFGEQVRAAIEMCRSLAVGGTPLHEIVVLCSTNAECGEVAEACRVADLAVFCRGSDYPQTPTTMLIEALAAWSVLGHEASGNRLGDLQRRWRNALGNSWVRRRNVDLVDVLMKFAADGSISAARFIRAILDVGLEDVLKVPVRSEDRLGVEVMLSSYSAGDLREKSVRDLGDRARNVDRVEVTTMTSSKGREFDAVLLLGVDEEKIPHYNSLSDAPLLAEDRRKFYVSLTRARHECHFFYSGFTVTPWGSVKRRGPSRFLFEIGLLER